VPVAVGKGLLGLGLGLGLGLAVGFGLGVGITVTVSHRWPPRGKSFVQIRLSACRLY